MCVCVCVTVRLTGFVFTLNHPLHMSDSHRDRGFEMRVISMLSDHCVSGSCKELVLNLTNRINQGQYIRRAVCYNLYK